MGVTRAGGVDRDDRRGGDAGDLVAARQHAARRPGPDDDPGRAVPPGVIGSARLAEQPAGGCGRVGHAGAGPGLPLVAAPPVAARPHRAQHSRRDPGDERTGVCEQQHAARQAGGPLPQDRARGGRGQPVAGNVDGVTGPGRDGVPAARLAQGFRAEAGDERALAAALHQGDVEAGVRSPVRRAQHGDALGGQRGTHQISPWPVAVAAGVQHWQALPGGGRHDVESAAHGRARRRGDHVAAPFGQRRDPHNQVDEGLAGEDQPPDSPEREARVAHRARVAAGPAHRVPAG